MTNINSILYTLLCIFLFWIIIYYISSNYYLIESMSNSNIIYSAYDINISKTNHTVNLPINTNYSCKNMCGPQSQCAITREQCSSDIDCYGCMPQDDVHYLFDTKSIEGDNDAGRLVYNQNPQYSELTTDIGTKAALYNNIDVQVPKPYLGIDKWMKYANIGMQYYYKAMNYPYILKPEKFKYLPEYSVRESVTGLFEDYGPLPANVTYL